jgi:hypothetical protein
MCIICYEPEHGLDNLPRLTTMSLYVPSGNVSSCPGHTRGFVTSWPSRGRRFVGNASPALGENPLGCSLTTENTAEPCCPWKDARVAVFPEIALFPREGWLPTGCAMARRRRHHATLSRGGVVTGDADPGIRSQSPATLPRSFTLTHARLHARRDLFLRSMRP